MGYLNSYYGASLTDRSLGSAHGTLYCNIWQKVVFRTSPSSRFKGNNLLNINHLFSEDKKKEIYVIYNFPIFQNAH